MLGSSHICKLAKYPEWESYSHRFPAWGFIQCHIAFQKNKSGYLDAWSEIWSAVAKATEGLWSRLLDTFVPTSNSEKNFFLLFLISGVYLISGSWD